MDIVSVIGNLFPWIIIASIFLGLTISIYLIHQKRKGTLQKSKFFSSFILLLLCCWLIIVIGITTLSRGSNYARMINLHLLSGYVNAWNKWSLSEFQLIIFNIIMFIPLGFLLPLYNQKLKNFSYVFLASFRSYIRY